MKKNLVSVIMPAYNSSKTIYKALDSIKWQNYRPLEIIIINDHSRDETLELLNKYDFEDIQFKIITNRINMGIGESRNIGLSNSTGEYIAFLDSDDQWIAKDKVKMQVNFMVNNIDYGFVCTAWTVNFFGKEIKQYHFKNEKDFQDLALEKYLAHTSTWLIRKKILKKIGFFWSKRAEDYEYLLRIGSVTKCWCINKVCSCNNHFPVSDSNKNKIKYYLLGLYICFLYRKTYPFFYKSFLIRIKRGINYIFRKLI